MVRSTFRRAAAVAALATTGLAGDLVAQSDGASRGVYTAEQARRGREAFLLACEECHTSSEFRGDDFEWTWRRQTAWNLYREMTSTMPEDDPGVLSDESYADIIAYILQLNDYAAGDADLSPSRTALESIPLGPGVEKNK